MARRLSIFCLAVVLASLGVSARDQTVPTKVLLTAKATAGQKTTYRDEFSFAIGRAVIMLQTTSTVTVADVSASGEITTEERQTRTEFKVNGQVVNDEVDDAIAVVVTRPNGTIVSSKRIGGKPRKQTPADDRNEYRLSQIGKMAFPPTPVGPGDTWTHMFADDPASKSVAAVAELTCVKFEKKQNVDTARLKIKYKESTGDKPITVTADVWIELTSGDIVRIDGSVQNIALPGMPPELRLPLLGGTFQRLRISGSPMR
jgi:hypothetical protein